MPDINHSVEGYYAKILNIIMENKIPFLIGGGFAVYKHTSLRYPTNDLDIFCKAGDFPKIITILREKDIDIKVLDERWLAQVMETEYHVDLLFSSPNYLVTVDDLWFENAVSADLFGCKIKIIPKEELIWCKAYVQDRNRFDGADINHLILITGKDLNWKRLLMRMENNWEILLSILISFRFVYPSKRDLIPTWLLKDLISRLMYQIENPTPRDKICRGPLISRTQYKIDITKLGFEAIN